MMHDDRVASKDSRQLGKSVLCSCSCVYLVHVSFDLQCLHSLIIIRVLIPVSPVSHPEWLHLALSGQVDGALNGKLASKEEVIRAQGETRV